MAVICKKCGLPDDLCACGELEKEETRIVVRLETRRFSKTTTLIEGIDPKSSNVHTMVKELKSKFACGGTAKGWLYYVTRRSQGGRQGFSDQERVY